MQLEGRAAGGMCLSIEKCVHDKTFLVRTVRLDVRYRNKMNEHERELRDVHLNLVMKKVVSLTANVSELQERVKHLEGSQNQLEELQEQLSASFQEVQTSLYD